MTSDCDRFVRSVGGDEAVSTAVISAVAAVTGTPPDELDLAKPEEIGLLHEAVNSDAIDSLFRGGAEGSLVFYWAGYEIEIDGGDQVIFVSWTESPSLSHPPGIVDDCRRFLESETVIRPTVPPLTDAPLARH